MNVFLNSETELNKFLKKIFRDVPDNAINVFFISYARGTSAETNIGKSDDKT